MRCLLRSSLMFSLVYLLALVPASSAASLTPKSAAGFRDSVGVNTHIAYYDTAYGDWSKIVQRLDELGIDHLRDSAYANPAPEWHDWNVRYDQAVELAAAHGKRFDFLMGSPGFSGGSLEDLAQAVAGPLRPAAEAIEAPNEFDNSGVADWPTELRSYVQALHDRAKGDPALSPLPLIGPSFARGDSPAKMGSVADAVDLGNLHPYTGGLAPTQDHTSHELASAALVSGNHPTMATEAGFHNALSATSGQPPVPEDVAAIYTLRALLEHYDAGIQRTYLYELIDEKPNPAADDAEQHFGLLRNDYSLKPAAIALQNLLSVIGRPGPVDQSHPVDVTVAGDTSGVRQLLLQDGAGHYRLVLWQSASLWDINQRVRTNLPSRSLAVTLPTTAVTAYQPVQSADGHALGVGGGQVQVSLGEDPLVLDFSASGSPAPAGGCQCANQAASSTPAGSTPLAGSAAAGRSTPGATVSSPGPRPLTVLAPMASVSRQVASVTARVASVIHRPNRIMLRLCTRPGVQLRAELGLRPAHRGRFHSLARAHAARSALCRVMVTLPPGARSFTTSRRRGLVVRVSWRAPGGRRRTNVEVALAPSSLATGAHPRSTARRA